MVDQLQSFCFRKLPRGSRGRNDGKLGDKRWFRVVAGTCERSHHDSVNAMAEIYGPGA